MNLRKTAIFTSLMSLLATIALTAQAQRTMDPEQAATPPFEELDRNVDGAITIDEAEGWLVYNFHKVDANQDGMISKAEYDETNS